MGRGGGGRGRSSGSSGSSGSSFGGGTPGPTPHRTVWKTANDASDKVLKKLDSQPGDLGGAARAGALATVASIHIKPPRNLPGLVKEIRHLSNGKELRKILTKELRREANPALKAVRTAALGLPSRGENARRGRPSLRRSLARATILQVRTTRSASVVIKTDAKKMPDGMRGLPPYIEGDNARLRHPTFGHEPWVNQRPMPFFYSTVEPYERRVEAAAVRASKEIEQRIKKHL